MTLLIARLLVLLSIQLSFIYCHEVVNNQVVFAFCTTTFTREKVPGSCKPLVKCVRNFHDIPQVANKPCTMKSGQLGVCCPFFAVPAIKKGKEATFSV